MKHVACYCRVSTDEQVKFGFSIQAQKDALKKYCKEHNYKYDFYIDEGISASSMKKRKALNEMLNKSNVFDAILFTKLDRLSRNVLDANNINKILQENHCTMKAIDEDDIDTSTADGTFMFNLKVSLAQREIGKTSERIRFVFKNKREKGEVTSGTKKFGYDIIDRKFQINHSEATKIIDLYNYFISVNGSIHETYKYFIKNFPSKGYDALKAYLRDTAYIGKYKLYRKNTYIDNYIPAIMDIDLFNQVQNLLQKKQVKKCAESKTSLFSGLVYCNECKGLMHKSQDNRVKKKTIRYKCNHASEYRIGTNQKKCSSYHSIREDFIEQYLLNNLPTEFEKFRYSTSLKKKTIKKVEPEKIKKIEKKLTKLKDLYLDDLIDRKEYESDYKKYSAELEKLKTQSVITKEQEHDYSTIQKLIISDYKSIYNKLSIDSKRKFWLSIIDKIYTSNAKIEAILFL